MILRQQVVHLDRADAAGDALAARLVMQNSMKNRATSTMLEVSSMTIMPAGAHDRAEPGERLVIDRDVEDSLGDAAAGRPAGLDGLERAAVGDAAADLEDDLAQRDAHGHFDQAGVVDLAGQGEDFGALALLGADAGEPVRAVADDRGDIGEGLDVVDEGRAAPEAVTRPGTADAAAGCRACPRSRRSAPSLRRRQTRRRRGGYRR